MINKVLEHQRRLTGDALHIMVLRYFVFISGGFIAWGLIALLYLFLNRFLGVGVAVSYAAGLVLADIFTFVYHRRITFNIRTNWKPRFIKFSVLVVALTFLNWAVFVFLVEVLGVVVPELSSSNAILYKSAQLFSINLKIASDIIISFFVTGFISVINFSISRIFIFRQP
ncbi:GtrA family protein [Candidatus Woesearchaeota archaeon]|nr:GtrA family protein [Candidatus Woesearchaeota archaeon]